MGAKRQGAKRRRRKSLLSELPFEQWDETVETAYAVESFPIRRVDAVSAFDMAVRAAQQFKCKPSDLYDGGWRNAYSYAHSDAQRDALDAQLQRFRAERIDTGVTVGLNHLDAMGVFAATLATLSSDSLYVEPVDETKRQIGIDAFPMWRSDRDDADELLVIPITSAYQDFLWPLLQIAVAAAGEAAMIVGRDVAAEKQGVGKLVGVGVRRVESGEKNELIRRCTAVVRDFLKDALADPKVALRVGRKAEKQRDHRAYCMRQWLVESPESDIASAAKSTRERQAKRRVKEHVTGQVSDSSWTRIMKNGRETHERLSPEKPFCDASRDLGLPFLVHRK